MIEELRTSAKRMGIQVRQSAELGAICFHDRHGVKLLNYLPQTGEWWIEDESGKAATAEEALQIAVSMGKKVDTLAMSA